MKRFRIYISLPNNQTKTLMVDAESRLDALRVAGISAAQPCCILELN